MEENKKCWHRDPSACKCDLRAQLAAAKSEAEALKKWKAQHFDEVDAEYAGIYAERLKKAQEEAEALRRENEGLKAEAKEDDYLARDIGNAIARAEKAEALLAATKEAYERECEKNKSGAREFEIAALKSDLAAKEKELADCREALTAQEWAIGERQKRFEAVEKELAEAREAHARTMRTWKMSLDLDASQDKHDLAAKSSECLALIKAKAIVDQDLKLQAEQTLELIEENRSLKGAVEKWKAEEKHWQEWRAEDAAKILALAAKVERMRKSMTAAVKYLDGFKCESLCDSSANFHQPECSMRDDFQAALSDAPLQAEKEVAAMLELEKAARLSLRHYDLSDQLAAIDAARRGE